MPAQPPGSAEGICRAPKAESGSVELPTSAIIHSRGYLTSGLPLSSTPLGRLDQTDVGRVFLLHADQVVAGIDVVDFSGDT